jgi:dTDP-4-dehydrorhamnose 3,5-epimerase
MEGWNRDAFRAAGIGAEFIQDNFSQSAACGTVRGMHYQRPPMAQSKLMTVLRGRIMDVVVDLRSNSPNFGRAMSIELAADGALLFIPAGFAHGYCTLEPDVLVHYKVDAPYSPAHEGTIDWQDPDLAIDWPVSATEAVMSPRDRGADPFVGRHHGF